MEVNRKIRDAMQKRGRERIESRLDNDYSDEGI
jgi:hypothetical protein